MVSADDIARSFALAATKRSQLLASGNWRQAEEEFSRLQRFRVQLRGLPDRGEAALKRIAGSDDPEVKIIAAAGLLALDEDFAVALLEQVRDTHEGILAATAEMTIQEWRNNSPAFRSHWK